MKDIRALFDKLTQLGPKYGYLVNPPKCQLIIKPGGERQASTEYTIQLASEKGASSWLNALPLSKHGFDLTKTEFRDGIALRYTWEAKNTPAICSCGKEFSLTHALHCAKGGYTHLRHNKIRDVFANLMDDVCHDVQIEPKLQSLDGEICASEPVQACCQVC